MFRIQLLFSQSLNIKLYVCISRLAHSNPIIHLRNVWPLCHFWTDCDPPHFCIIINSETIFLDSYGIAKLVCRHDSMTLLATSLINNRYLICDNFQFWFCWDSWFCANITPQWYKLQVGWILWGANLKPNSPQYLQVSMAQWTQVYGSWMGIVNTARMNFVRALTNYTWAWSG